jgi:predicted ATPase/type II secretory pathway predicted ATPase ExeA
MAVLAYLAGHSGRLVSKDELREQVWGTIHVSDTTLRVTVREIRAVLGEDQRHLETVPGRGYRFVPDPDASSGSESVEGQGTELPPVDQGEPIVGRQREVEYLLSRFIEADKGRRQLVFVGGEPGAGKTTLVQLFLERLTGRPDTTVIDGHCVMSFGASEAYGPVLEALGSLAQEPGGAECIRLLDRYAPMWLVQLPALVESAKLERLQQRIKGATRERMIRELNDFLEHLTTRTTLVLVLEDLHWSDMSTLALLTSIAQRHEAARLLILGTYRPAEAVLSAPALRQAIRELEGRGFCEHLNLELLTGQDVGAYVTARLGGTRSEDVAAQVFERSEGNPLFMVNVFDHLLQTRAIRMLGGSWSVEGAAAVLSQVPDGLRPFIQRGFDVLSAEERRILEIASVAGIEFAAADLSSGTSPADLQQDLERLEPELEGLSERTRLIDSCGVTEWLDGMPSARYRFCHALYRQGLYDEIPEARRVRLHRRIGEHLRVAFGAEAGSLAPVLAVHFERGRDPEKAAGYRRMAGERALRLHAYHEASQHFQKALDAFDQARGRLADGASEDPLHWEIEVCTKLGAVLNVTRGHADPDVRKIQSRVRLLVEHLDDPAAQLQILFGLWTFSTAAAELAESAHLVTQMLELTAGTENDELLLMAHCARARTCFLRGEFAESADSVRQVLTLYDPLRSGDLPERYGQDEPGVISQGVDGWRLWLQGYPAQAATRVREACELAERLDTPWAKAFAGVWVLLPLQLRGDTTELERRADDLHRLSTEHGFSEWIGWATFFKGWVAGTRANEADGISLMERGLDAWRGTGAHILEPYLLALLCETWLRAGRIEAAGKRLAEARAQVERSGECWWEAELHRLEGEILLAAADDGGHDSERGDRAEACFRSALEVARRQQARSLELRAALSLSCLWSQSRRAEAHQLLGEVLETFTEGHDTADLRAAREQMARLSRAD